MEINSFTNLPTQILSQNNTKSKNNNEKDKEQQDNDININDLHLISINLKNYKSNAFDDSSFILNLYNFDEAIK